MTKFKQKSRYNLAESVMVYVGENRYFVFLDSEIGVQEISGAGGKNIRRRVTSKRIETEAILKASDIFYKGEM